MRHVEAAPAKINLGLKVLRRRPDGFHDILSLMHTVDLCDEVCLEQIAGDGRTLVACDADGVPGGSENLAYRAVEAFREATGLDTGIHVELVKRIPAGGGLGGGSSDAAAVLRGLCRFVPQAPSRKRLVALARGLGSDVPFLVRGGAAIAHGRGERLTPVTWPDRYHYVLVDPGFRVSTAWAFTRVRIGLTGISEYDRLLNSGVESGSAWPDALLAHIENDFLPLISDAHPEVVSILSSLWSSGALAASLSGTGATLFGVYRAPEPAARAADAIEALGYRSYGCRSAVGHPESEA